jgi:hypothetical protein
MQIRSFRWSFPQAPFKETGPHHMDGGPDLASDNCTLRNAMDACGSTSNP